MDDKMIFADMVQILMKSNDKLQSQGTLTRSDHDSINRYLGCIKQVLYQEPDFKMIYKAYCKQAVRLIG